MALRKPAQLTFVPGQRGFAGQPASITCPEPPRPPSPPPGPPPSSGGGGSCFCAAWGPSPANSGGGGHDGGDNGLVCIDFRC